MMTSLEERSEVIIRGHHVQGTHRKLTEGVKEFFADWLSPSACASSMILMLAIFNSDALRLFSLASPFMCLLAIYLLFTLVFVGSVVKACIKRAEETTLRRFRFVILNYVVLSISMFFPFTELLNDLDFNLNFKKRMEAVEMAARDKLDHLHDDKSVCSLPSGWKYLSKGGGEVIVTDAGSRTKDFDSRTLHVLFFTDREMQSHCAGFEYAADGNPNTPQMAKCIEFLNLSQLDPADSVKPDEVKLLRKNWFWVHYSAARLSF